VGLPHINLGSVGRTVGNDLARYIGSGVRTIERDWGSGIRNFERRFTGVERVLGGGVRTIERDWGSGIRNFERGAESVGSDVEHAVGSIANDISNFFHIRW